MGLFYCMCDPQHTSCRECLEKMNSFFETFNSHFYCGINECECESFTTERKCGNMLYIKKRKSHEQ